MQATFSTLCLLTGFVLQSTKRQTIVCSSSATQKHPSSFICGVLVKNCLISSSNLINWICPFCAIEFLHCSLLWWGTVKSLLISHSCYNSITHHGVMAVLHSITSGKSRGFNSLFMLLKLIIIDDTTNSPETIHLFFYRPAENLLHDCRKTHWLYTKSPVSVFPLGWRMNTDLLIYPDL